MFDRYSNPARNLVALAEEEAQELGHSHIGTEHLLLGLLSDRHNALARALPTGTTLPVVRRKVAEAVGNNSSGAKGKLTFTPRAKRALERASRFSLQRHAAQVQVNHVLLGVLDVEGTAGQVLRGLGVDVARLREAADRTGAERASSALDTAPPLVERSSPRCTGCGAALDAELSFQIREVRGEKGDRRRLVVAYCSSCGSALGVTPE